MLGCDENLYANFYPTFGGGRQSTLCFVVLLLGCSGNASYSVHFFLEMLSFYINCWAKT